MSLVRLLAVIVLLSGIAGAQTVYSTGTCVVRARPRCFDLQAITASNGTIQVVSNGGMTPSFEYLISGSPSTVSISIYGVGALGASQLLDTYRTVGNTIRNLQNFTNITNYALPSPFEHFLVVASWTGGSIVSVSVSTIITTFRNGSDRSGTEGQAAESVFNVKAYGAPANGSWDDAPAVRLAQAAAVANGGGTIDFPPGNYNFASIQSGTGAIFQSTSSHIHFKCEPGATLTSKLQYPMFVMGWQQTSWGSTYNINAIMIAGMSQITLTTPANASNFKVGDVILIYGGPGTESNDDDELNWVVSANAMTGVITLLKPTSKPYAGNVAEGGRVSTPYVYDVNTNYVYDDSIEGCTATPSDDFAYIGEVIGAKVANNRVTFQNSGRGGMLINSYYPMADIDIADNVVVGRTGGSTIIQMATGWRDIKIHDNDFTSYGTWVLNPSQGIINTTIEHNTFYTTNSEAIQFSGAYKLVINGNVFTVADSVNAYPQAVALGLSNGSCVHCTFSNNIVDLYPDFLFEIEAIAFMMAATPVFMRL